MTKLVSLTDIRLFRFSISSVSFDNLCFLQMCPFYELSDLKAQLFIVSPCYPLNVYRICNDVPFSTVKYLGQGVGVKRARF